MILLATNISVLRKICLYPNILGKSTFTDKVLTTAIAYLLYNMLFTAVAYFFIDAQTMEDFTAATYTIGIYFLFSNVYVGKALQKDILERIINSLQEVVNARK